MKIGTKMLWMVCLLAVFLLQAKETVYASDTGKIEKAKQGVMQIFSGIEDNAGEFHCIQNTCGCIVSSLEDSNYIITTYSGIHIPDKKLNEYITAHQLDIEKSNQDIVIKLVVQDDIMADVTVVAESEKKDFCILKSESTIYERGALLLGEAESAAKDADIYVMGFSEHLIESDNAGFTTSELLFYKGTVKEQKCEIDGADYIQHTGLVNKGNSGGALLDAAGYLIGLNNEGKSDSASGLYVSLSIDEIRTILNNYGIAYIDKKQDVEFKEFQKLYDECKALYETGNYKKSSLVKMQEALNGAGEVILEENIDSAVIAEWREKLAQAKTGLKTKTPVQQFMIYGLAAVVAVVLIWAVLLTLDCRKNNWYREE